MYINQSFQGKNKSYLLIYINDDRIPFNINNNFTFTAILEDPCSHCHINAKCSENGCVCRDGFTGNGVYCERGED